MADHTLPDSFDTLATTAGILPVIAPGDNLKGGAFVPWRVGFYVTGDESSVKNALLLLDSFFQREVRAVNGEPIVIHIYAHKGLEGILSVKEELDYPRYEYHSAETMPLFIFQAQLPKGGTPVVLNVQVQDENHVGIVISGSTWPFRSKFASAGIAGGYAKPDAEDKGPYVRSLPDLDVSRDDEKQRVWDMLGDAVFNHLAVRLLVEGDVEEESASERFIQELKDRSNVHFYSAGA